MADFEEHKKFWRIFYSPLVFIVLLITFILLARAVWSVYGHEQLSAKDRERVEGELASVSVRAQVLKGQVQDLQTPQGVDDEIRSKFNVVKAGEGVAVIVNGAQATTATTTYTTDRTWWQKVVDFFTRD